MTVSRSCRRAVDIEWIFFFFNVYFSNDVPILRINFLFSGNIFYFSNFLNYKLSKNITGKIPTKKFCFKILLKNLTQQNRIFIVVPYEASHSSWNSSRCHTFYLLIDFEAIFSWGDIFHKYLTVWLNANGWQPWTLANNFDLLLEYYMWQYFFIRLSYSIKKMNDIVTLDWWLSKFYIVQTYLFQNI